MIAPNTSGTTRTDGNNIRNKGNRVSEQNLDAVIQHPIGLSKHVLRLPKQRVTVNDIMSEESASLAGLLNRIEQSVWLNLQWQVRPETMFLVGGNFGLVNYTADEPIALSYPLEVITGNPFYYSDNRNNRSYIGYLGFQLAFLGQSVSECTGRFSIYG